MTRFFLTLLLFVSLLSGCTATRTTLIDARAPLVASQIEAAHNAVVVALLDAGFDLKMNDREVRLVTTEYKKYASVSGWPPFDFYLRVKVHIRQDAGGTHELTITPTIKEQNRLNANAFTEHAVVLYSETEQRDDYVVKSDRGQAMLTGQRKFIELLHDIAQRLGLSDDQFRRQVKTAELMGL